MLFLLCPNNYEIENILRKDIAHKKECPVEISSVSITRWDVSENYLTRTWWNTKSKK